MPPPGSAGSATSWRGFGSPPGHHARATLSAPQGHLRGLRQTPDPRRLLLLLTTTRRDSLFLACAAGAGLAALFHAVAMVSPAVAQHEYEPGYPMWRHVLFIVVDGSLAWLFIRRPLWLPWAFGALTLHILNGHGRAAWRLWVTRGEIAWISVAVSLAAPIALVLLIFDRRARRAPAVHG